MWSDQSVKCPAQLTRPLSDTQFIRCWAEGLSPRGKSHQLLRQERHSLQGLDIHGAGHEEPVLRVEVIDQHRDGRAGGREWNIGHILQAELA